MKKCERGEWTLTEDFFAQRGEAVGARLFRVCYPEPGDGPNRLVLFPNGYIEAIDVLSPEDTRYGVPASTARELGDLHHPVVRIHDRASAAEYWRKRAYRFFGGAQNA